MKELIQITDYQAEALKVLLVQYKDSVNLQGVISGKTYQVDDLEIALFEIRDLFYLDVAEGQQLNVFGRIWNVLRDGKNDTEYREAINFQISLKISGTLPEILSVLKAFFDATYMEYYPHYPAKYLLVTDATITRTELENITSAGVGVILKNRDDLDAKVFGFHAPGDDSRFALTHNLNLLKPYIT